MTDTQPITGGNLWEKTHEATNAARWDCRPESGAAADHANWNLELSASPAMCRGRRRDRRRERAAPERPDSAADSLTLPTHPITSRGVHYSRMCVHFSFWHGAESPARAPCAIRLHLPGYRVAAGQSGRTALSFVVTVPEASGGTTAGLAAIGRRFGKRPLRRQGPATPGWRPRPPTTLSIAVSLLFSSTARNFKP